MTTRFRGVGLAIGLASMSAFMVYALHTIRLHDLSYYTSPLGFVAICSAASFYVLSIPISAFAWRQLLGRDGRRHSWREFIEIMSITQMAKYVPGSIVQYVSRAGMASIRGIRFRTYAISVTTETVMALLAALVIGFGCISLSKAGAHVVSHYNIAAMVFFGALGTTIIAIPVFGRRTMLYLLQRFALVDRGKPFDLDALPSSAAVWWASLGYCGNYLLIGAGISVMAFLLPHTTTPDPFLLTGGFALAWVMGFLALGAPAGLGVREGLMLATLRPTYSGPDAVLLIVAIRLATIVGDTFAFVVGSALWFASERNKLGKEAASK